MTSVDDELFVLLSRPTNQVAVHSIDDHQPLRHLNLSQPTTRYFCNLTSCARHECLYGSERCRIHTYNLASGAISKWAVPGKPCGLSVTPGCNLLVTCQRPNKLVELSVDSGQSVREISLQSDIAYPWHGVQLTTGQYVVCHGSGSSFHRVCVVDGAGRVTRSYGGQRGSDVGQLDRPCHLAVDEDSQLIVVADWGNDRVVLLLRSTLDCVCDMSGEGLSRPDRLCLHHPTRRLYVGQLGGDVVVIQL